MGEALLVRKGGGGSKVINGILEEYYAESDVISADTFISFLDNVPTTYFCKSDGSSNEPLAFQTIKLSDTKVLIIIAPTYSYQQQYAAIDLGADGAAIGTTTVYSTPSGYYAKRERDIAYIRVSDTDILLFFSTNKYSTATLVGLWVSVDLETNEVTVEANPYTIDSTTGYINMLSNAINLESSKFLIVTKRGTSSKYPVYAYVLQINASAKTVTVLNKLTLTTEGSDIEYYPRLVRMSEEQYCLLRSAIAVDTFNLDSTYSTVSNYLKTQIGTPSTSVPAYIVYNICKISSNRAIVFFSPTSTTLAASFITINNGVVNVDKTISEVASFSSGITYGYLQAYYEDGKVTLYLSINSGQSKKIIFEVNDGASTLSLKSNTDFYDPTIDGAVERPDGTNFNAVSNAVLPLTHNSLFVLLGGGGYEKAFKVIRSEKTAIPATSKIDGLTKNQLSTTKKGNVWTLE